MELHMYDECSETFCRAREYETVDGSSRIKSPQERYKLQNQVQTRICKHNMQVQRELVSSLRDKNNRQRSESGKRGVQRW